MNICEYLSMLSSLIFCGMHGLFSCFEVLCPSLCLWRLIILPSSRHYSRHYSRHHLVHHLLCVGCVPPKPSPQHDVAPLALCNVALARSGMSSQAAAQAKRRRGEDRSRNSIMAGLQASVRNLHGIVSCSYICRARRYISLCLIT